jgi:iron complex transport system substrate-binding protein
LEAQRIVSLSPTHTEILYAIGAGDQVVAVDSMSNFPADAAITDLSSYEPNVEAIAEFDPDLVVIGDDFTGLADQLAAIGVESWVSSAPVSLDEAYAQIVDLGSAVGRSEAASELANSMKADIEEIIAGAAQLPEGTSYFLELDDTLYSVTSNTFVGSIFDMFGLRNIADATEGDTDYPQLSAEFIVSQDPTLIFLADTKCCGASAETVAARPGWDVLSAVINGHVFGLDDDIASRWGPRLVDFVAAIADALKVAGSE